MPTDRFANVSREMTLLYNSKDRVAYCSIPKAASSTWCWHFIKLGLLSTYVVYRTL